MTDVVVVVKNGRKSFAIRFETEIRNSWEFIRVVCRKEMELLECIMHFALCFLKRNQLDGREREREREGRLIFHTND
jgi:hypothetical protein